MTTDLEAPEIQIFALKDQAAVGQALSQEGLCNRKP